MLAVSYLSNQHLLKKYNTLQPEVTRWCKRVVAVDKSSSSEEAEQQASEIKKMASNGNALIFGYYVIKTCTECDNLIKIIVQ